MFSIAVLFILDWYLFCLKYPHQNFLEKELHCFHMVLIHLLLKGSGLASSMFSLTVRGSTETIAKQLNISDRLGRLNE